LGLYGKDTVKSTVDGKSKKQHFLVLKNTSKKRIVTDLAPMTRQGTKKYGIHLWEPKYKWDVKVTPGIKVTVGVRAGNWINKSFTVGPLWLDSLTIDLGTIILPHHKGTQKGYRNKPARSRSRRTEHLPQLRPFRGRESNHVTR